MYVGIEGQGYFLTLAKGRECWSHDQDGRHAHVWSKSFKSLLWNRQADFHETWYLIEDSSPS